MLEGGGTKKDGIKLNGDTIYSLPNRSPLEYLLPVCPYWTLEHTELLLCFRSCSRCSIVLKKFDEEQHPSGGGIRSTKVGHGEEREVENGNDTGRDTNTTKLKLPTTTYKLFSRWQNATLGGA